jgi:hypothetical protein
MTIERMDGGWRLLVWRKRNRLALPTWKTHYYKLALRIFRDSYGLQFSATVAK